MRQLNDFCVQKYKIIFNKPTIFPPFNGKV